VANKTVYPVPGIHLPGIKSEEQSVDETWAAELVASGAFRYTDISDEAKQSLVDQEVKRVLDAQQSNAEISLAKMEEKLAKTDKLPAEAVAIPSPTPAESAVPRAIAGIDQADIQAAVDKASPKAAKDVKLDKGTAPKADDQTGGLQVTK